MGGSVGSGEGVEIDFWVRIKDGGVGVKDGARFEGKVGVKGGVGVRVGEGKVVLRGRKTDTPPVVFGLDLCPCVDFLAVCLVLAMMNQDANGLKRGWRDKKKKPVNS